MLTPSRVRETGRGNWESRRVRGAESNTNWRCKGDKLEKGARGQQQIFAGKRHELEREFACGKTSEVSGN